MAWWSSPGLVPSGSAPDPSAEGNRDATCWYGPGCMKPSFGPANM